MGKLRKMLLPGDMLSVNLQNVRGNEAVLELQEDTSGFGTISRWPLNPARPYFLADRRYTVLSVRDNLGREIAYRVRRHETMET